MEILHQFLGSILVAVLIPVAGAVGALLGKLIKAGISHINNRILQDVAWQAVLWVEQTAKGIEGSKKFSKALDWITRKIPDVSYDEAEKAIETAVKQMNAQFPKVPSSQPK